MKKFLALFVAVMIASWTAHPLHAETVSQAYGYQIGDENLNLGFISFPVDGFGTPTMEKSVSLYSDQIGAAAYFDGKLYACMVEFDDFGDTYPLNFAIYDAETYTLLETKNSLDRLMHDMAYDYTTNTLYGLVEVKENSSRLIEANLCIIDPETGNYREVGEVGSLQGGALLTLAADSKGDLYAMSEYRILYKLDKNTGAATPVGKQHSLSVINMFQSMDFDANDVLYWAHQSPDYGWFTTIDVTTGVPTKLGTLGLNAQLSSLYFKRAANQKSPLAVEAFTATLDENDHFEVTLTWNNPTKSYDQAPLTAIEGVRIYKLGVSEPIADIKTTEIGASCSFVYNDSVSGSAVFRAIPYSSEGAGFPAESEIFVGFDQPEAPTNVVAEEAEGVVTITWTAPTETIHGGYADFDNITYNLYRVQGYEAYLIAEGLTETVANDTLTESGEYKYAVEACAGDALSELAISSNSVLIAGSFTMPYSTGFEADQDAALWTIVNRADVGSNGWSIKTSSWGAFDGAFAQCASGSSSLGACNDWFISPALEMEAGAYTLTYAIHGGYDPQDYDVLLGTSTDTIDFTQTISNVVGYDNSSWAVVERIFTVESAGTYHLAFHCKTNESYATMKIDQLSIVEAAEYDAAITAIYPAPPSDKMDANTPLSVVIANKGAKPFSNFTVTAQTAYRTQEPEAVEHLLNPGEEFTYQLANGVDLSEFGLHAIRAIVSLENDATVENDSSDIVFTYHVAAATVPYTLGFEADEELELYGWNTYTTVNSEYQGWELPVTPGHTGTQSMGYNGGYSLDADHWIWSKGIELEAGKNYKLSYYAANSYSDDTNIWSVGLATAQTVEATTILKEEEQTSSISKDWKLKEVIFTAPADGVYYLSWHITSEAGNSDFMIDDITVESVLAQSVQVDKVSIQTPVSTETALVLQLTNNGCEAIQSINVSYSVNGGELHTESAAVEIAPLSQAEYICSVKYDLSQAGDYAIQASATVGDVTSESSFTLTRRGDYDLDFELGNDFETVQFTTQSGAVWSTSDGDEADTYAIGTYNFPGSGTPYAAIAFAPAQASPSLEESTSFAAAEEGGARYGMFMSANFYTCDDWLISPRIAVTDATAAFEMLARDVRSKEDEQSDFYIEVATTEALPTFSYQYTRLTPEVQHVTTSWETYSYSLSEYVGDSIWLAIHHVSKSQYAMLVDNLTFKGCAGSLNETVSGVAESQAAGVTLAQVGEECILTSAQPISSYQLYTLQGALVRSESGMASSNVRFATDALSQGVYILKVTNSENEVTTLKLLLR